MGQSLRSEGPRNVREVKSANPASSMTYLNAYAIPKGIKKAEAFDEVKSHRAALIESRPPAEIMRRANRCVDRSPFWRWA